MAEKTQEEEFKEALTSFNSFLPGWWWCVSMGDGFADAACGPVDKKLKNETIFEFPFQCEAKTPGEALRNVTGIAVMALHHYNGNSVNA